jgi:hypothetical protein
VDLVLSGVFGGIERQFWGVLLRRWIDVHDSGFPNVVQLFVLIVSGPLFAGIRSLR